MRIAVLSDTKLPTLPDGPHGLGRSAHDIATGLSGRGHDITLFAAKGSAFDAGQLITSRTEVVQARAAASMDFDAYLDTSHHHRLSQSHPDLPVVNRMADRQCKWQPPNAVVNSPFMGEKYGGHLVNTGIHWAGVPFYAEHDGYLAFMSAQLAHKGHDTAKRVAAKAGRRYREATELVGRAKWDFMGKAYALLHPSTIDAAPRLPLEAAACGVPTLCLPGDGSEYHVNDGVTGFVCQDEAEMARLIATCEVSALDRGDARQWVADTHGLSQMIDDYNAMLGAVAGGRCW